MPTPTDLTSAADVASRAASLGPCGTVLRLSRTGDGDAPPLRRLAKALEAVGRDVQAALGPDGYRELHRIVGAAFRMARQFAGAAWHLEQAGADDDLDELAELAWAFGDLGTLRRLDARSVARGAQPVLGSAGALREFVITRVVPAMPLDGDQYQGFRLDGRLLEDAAAALAPTTARELVRETALHLERVGCEDEAKLYVLAAQAGDPGLISRAGTTFGRAVALPRGRCREVVAERFPDHRVEVIHEGDAAGVHPRRRFVLSLTAPDGSCTILKEVLPLTCEVPGERGLAHEDLILGSWSIDGVPPLLDVVDVQGIRFLRLGVLPGRTLRQILEREGLLPPARALRLLADLARILADLHERGTAHLDIREDCLLWDGQTVGLVGFDRARRLQGQREAWLTPGCPSFVAPETVRRFRAGTAADCFALGLLAHRLLTGRAPFGRPAVPTPVGGDPHRLLLDFGLPCLFLPPDLRRDDLTAIHDGLPGLVEGLLEKDPCRRTTAEGALGALREMTGSAGGA